MRIGIIGLGLAGRVHLDGWRATPDAEIVAIVDPSSEARTWARDNGLKAYDDAYAMLAREQLDAVSIATPPAGHGPLTLACLERGLHVLCEKPLATNPGDALGMLAAAASADRHLVLATKFRHVPDVLRARELIASGEIGEPLTFEIVFSSVVDMTTRWNSRTAVAGGGVIIDNGCHAFDLVSFLFGTVSRVHATRLKPGQDMPVEDTATVLVGAGSALIGRIDLSWSLATYRESYITIHCTKGTVEIGWRGSQVRMGQGVPRPLGNGYDKHDAHRRMMGAFTQVVTAGARPWITAAEAMRTVAAVDAAYRSLDAGTWQTLDMPAVREVHRYTNGSGHVGGRSA